MSEMSAVQTPAAVTVSRPYSPSWIDRFTDRVDRLAGPSWLFYAGLWLVLYLIEIATQWTGDIASAFRPFHIFFVGTIPLNLALIHYLDRTAEIALSKFRTVLDCSDSEYAELRYRLTTLPARPVLVVALISIAVDVFFPTSESLARRIFADNPASNMYNFVVSFVLSILVCILIYHTLHQLMVVNQIYSRARVNLFNLGPLYTFSNLSARTAIGILAIAYSWYATLPEFFREQSGSATGLALLGAGVLTFIWPLWGVHNLLVEKKQALLAECTQQQEMAIAKLHRSLHTDKLEGMDDLNKLMASLEVEHTMLSRISTWPWQPETVRWFVAALLFPVIVWLMQWILQRVLGT